MIPPVNLKTLKTLFSHMAERVLYKLGAKAPRLDCDSSEIKVIDCSGWSRYALYRATDGALTLPEGSQAQLDWCKESGLHRLAHYSDVKYAEFDPSRLFIAFLSPRPGKEWPRHVWLLRGGPNGMRTLESCGSHGVCSRAWDNPNLVSCVACFELPTS